MFPYEPDKFPAVPSYPALIILDLQNDFCSPDGALPILQPPDLVGRATALAREFRGPDRFVIWVRSVFVASRPINLPGGESESDRVITDKELLLPLRQKYMAGSNAEDSAEEGDEQEDDGGASKNALPLRVDITGEGALSELGISEDTFLTIRPSEKASLVLPSSTGTNFAQELLNEIDGQRDLVFQKTWYSAFKDGALIEALRKRFIRDLYFCGAFSNTSVFASVMDAACDAFELTLVEDCLGYRSKGRHDEALRELKESTGCRVSSSHDVIEKMEQKARDHKPTTWGRIQRPRLREPSRELDSSMGKLVLDPKESSSILTPDGKSSGQSEEVAANEATKHQTTFDDSNESPESNLPARFGIGVKGKKRERVEKSVRGRRRRSKSEKTGGSSSESLDSQSPPKLLDSAGPATRDETQEPSKENMAAICEGDASVTTNLLDSKLADHIYEKIRDEVRWQNMSHMGGDVPRLVAVQGSIAEDGSFPIYRHPADEMPPLLPFSPTMSLIAAEVEKNLGHPVNHVLAQFYRDSTDHITEHSDKTLDIVPGTFIADVSLGAQRTMVLRTKKPPKGKEIATSEVGEDRQVCRAVLPHNSMFKMGLVTNMRWLHGIRPDKRLDSEKTAEELAFNCCRISLTFRHIGTFLNKDQTLIWGQGATSKVRETAKSVINGDHKEAEEMTRAFGTENHSAEFDWKAIYGKGFDVLHMEDSPKLFLSGNFIADTRVKILLADYGIEWTEGKVSPPIVWKDGIPSKDAPAIHERLPVKFVDKDPSRSTIIGDIAILLYIDAVYGNRSKLQPNLARQYTRLYLSEELLKKWHGKPFNEKLLRRELETWEGFAAESEYMAGSELSVVDYALFPVIESIFRDWKSIEDFDALVAFYNRMNERESVTKVLGALEERLAERE